MSSIEPREQWQHRELPHGKSFHFSVTIARDANEFTEFPAPVMAVFPATMCVYRWKSSVAFGSVNHGSQLASVR